MPAHHQQGQNTKVPLQKMPLIDQPFKRVAVDLVGPISPPSENGHQYILTLVDYATRYPEAIALKRIDTPTVAEALVDMFSRLEFQKKSSVIWAPNLCRNVWKR